MAYLADGVAGRTVATPFLRRRSRFFIIIHVLDIANAKIRSTGRVCEVCLGGVHLDL